MKIFLGEQILFLRKKRGITQEHLAKKIGVSNQAVSKWEAGQCFPDAQLIPEIAKFFHVSIDELYGYKNGMDDNEYRLSLQVEDVNSITDKEYSDLLACIKIAHAIIWRTEIKDDDAFAKLTLEDIIGHMVDGEWGISSVVLPRIVTIMRNNCVFFSDGREVYLGEDETKGLCKLFTLFSERWLLSIFLSIYNMTCQSIEDYATYERIAADTMISEEKIKNIIEKELINYLSFSKGRGGFRLKDEYKCIVPIISLLIYTL